MTDNPTPNDMSGLKAELKPESARAEPKPELAKPEADEKTELDRLRKIHADETKWEKRAKQNFDDAQKFRALLEAAGVEKPNEFDPQAEFVKLRKEVETERTERMRADVARIKGVDPEDVRGSTAEEMNVSADRYLQRLNARIEEALKTKSVPSSAPASTVTSDGKITGPEQITSHEQLKTMSPKQIMAARKEGRLNHLLGKTKE